MKNVTISMDEATLAWVRVEAAKAGLSVSRWVGERLGELRAKDSKRAEAIAAMNRFLDSPGWDLDLANNPFNREEIYDERLRGLERRRLHARSKGDAQARHGEGVAESPNDLWRSDDEPAGDE